MFYLTENDCFGQGWSKCKPNRSSWQSICNKGLNFSSRRKYKLHLWYLLYTTYLCRMLFFWPQIKLTHFVKINFEIHVYSMKYFNQNLFCDIIFHMFIQMFLYEDKLWIDAFKNINFKIPNCSLVRLSSKTINGK